MGCTVPMLLVVEPVLQWDLGTETPTISQVADQVGSKVFMRTSTCTNDVAVIAFQTTEPTAGTAYKDLGSAPSDRSQCTPSDGSLGCPSEGTLGQILG